METREVWRPVPSWEGMYEVSDLGNVRSLREFNGRKRGHMLKAWVARKKERPNAKGYRYVAFSKESKVVNKAVARLVAEAFLGPQGLRAVDHVNGDTLDDRLSNLRHKTTSGNARAFRTRTPRYKSKYRGVSWDKVNEKWRAKIKLDGKHICLGRFADQIDAARAWDSAAKASGYAQEALNFPA